MIVFFCIFFMIIIFWNIYYFLRSCMSLFLESCVRNVWVDWIMLLKRFFFFCWSLKIFFLIVFLVMSLKIWIEFFWLILCVLFIVWFFIVGFYYRLYSIIMFVLVRLSLKLFVLSDIKNICFWLLLKLFVIFIFFLDFVELFK